MCVYDENKMGPSRQSGKYEKPRLSQMLRPNQGRKNLGALTRGAQNAHSVPRGESQSAWAVGRIPKGPRHGAAEQAGSDLAPPPHHPPSAQLWTSSQLACGLCWKAGLWARAAAL